MAAFKIGLPGAFGHFGKKLYDNLRVSWIIYSFRRPVFDRRIKNNRLQRFPEVERTIEFPENHTQTAGRFLRIPGLAIGLGLRARSLVTRITGPEL